MGKGEYTNVAEGKRGWVGYKCKSMHEIIWNFKQLEELVSGKRENKPAIVVGMAEYVAVKDAQKIIDEPFKKGDGKGGNIKGEE